MSTRFAKKPWNTVILIVSCWPVAIPCSNRAPLDSFLPKCAERNASVIIGGVYNSNILVLGTRSKHQLYYNYETAPAEIIERVRRLETVCDDFQVSLPAAALQFPLACPAVAGIIVGHGESATHSTHTGTVYLLSSRRILADAPC